MTLFPPAVTMISFILCLLKALVRKVNSSLRGWKGHLDAAGDPAPSLSELKQCKFSSAKFCLRREYLWDLVTIFNCWKGDGVEGREMELLFLFQRIKITRKLV